MNALRPPWPDRILAAVSGVVMLFFALAFVTQPPVPGDLVAALTLIGLAGAHAALAVRGTHPPVAVAVSALGCAVAAACGFEAPVVALPLALYSAAVLAVDLRWPVWSAVGAVALFTVARLTGTRGDDGWRPRGARRRAGVGRAGAGCMGAGAPAGWTAGGRARRGGADRRATPGALPRAARAGRRRAHRGGGAGRDGGPPECHRTGPQPAAVAVRLVVQEALTNALRHAPSVSVDLSVTEQDGAWAVRVSNPAPPHADPGQAGRRSGLGLVGLRERVTATGGTLAYGHEGDRFELTAVVPEDSDR